MFLVSSVFLICCCVLQVYGSEGIEISFGECDRSTNCTQKITITKHLGLLRLNHTYLPSNLIQSYEILEIIDASNMELTDIRANTFNKADNLVKLYLQNNQLKAIEKFSFVGAKNLTELNLSNNSINFVSSKCFWDLTKLEKLELQNNEIEILVKLLFVKNENLEYLDLSGNKIRKISVEVFPISTSLTIVNFKGNECIDEIIEDSDIANMTSLFDSLNCTLKQVLLEIDPVNYSQRALIMWICIGLLMSVEIACLGVIFKRYKPPSKVEVIFKKTNAGVFIDIES